MMGELKVDSRPHKWPISALSLSQEAKAGVLLPSNLWDNEMSVEFKYSSRTLRLAEEYLVRALGPGTDTLARFWTLGGSIRV
jgi:hypothetical protein